MMNMAAEKILATSTLVKGLRILLYISYNCMAVSLAVYYYYYYYYYVFEVFKIKSSVKSTYATLKLELQLDFQHANGSHL